MASLYSNGFTSFPTTGSLGSALRYPRIQKLIKCPSCRNHTEGIQFLLVKSLQPRGITNRIQGRNVAATIVLARMLSTAGDRNPINTAQTWTSDMQNCERRDTLLEAAKLVVTCYDSNRKLMHIPSQLWRGGKKKKSFHKFQEFSKKLLGTQKPLDPQQQQ